MVSYEYTWGISADDVRSFVSVHSEALHSAAESAANSASGYGRALGPNAQRSTNLESSNFNTLLTKALLKLIEL